MHTRRRPVNVGCKQPRVCPAGEPPECRPEALCVECPGEPVEDSGRDVRPGKLFRRHAVDVMFLEPFRNGLLPVRQCKPGRVRVSGCIEEERPVFGKRWK